jgi:tetrahydromethanopterin S-methyltransferase subunit G
MESKTATKKFGLDNGIYYGLAMILSFVIVYALNIDLVENPFIGTISSVLSYFVFPILFIWLAISGFKKANSSFASFGECLKTGVTVAFVASVLLAVFSLIFNLVFPEYLDEMMNQTRKIMLKQNPSLTSEQVDASLVMVKKFSSPMFSIPMTILMITFVGLIYSLVIGAILKNERPQFN